MKFCLAAALLVCASSAYSGSFINDQAARAVVGQYEFGRHDTAGNQQITGGVSGIAFDSVRQELWVVDSNLVGVVPLNNRVVGFSTLAIQGPTADLSVNTSPVGDFFCALCGYQANVVLGQVDYFSFNPGTAQSASSNAAGSMNTPTAVATDGVYFAVADTQNSRVLLWNHVPLSVNTPADIVLGQPNFTSGQAQPISASSMRAPQGVWIQNGKLYVADTGNSRVLIWNSIPTTNGQPADLELGEPDFASNVSPTTSTTSNPIAAPNLLWDPFAVTVSPDGSHLFVADTYYNRILIWNEIPTRNQQPADVEIGQVDMGGSTSNNSSGLCASNGTDSNNNPTYPDRCEKTLSQPRFVLSDGTRLFVADTGNDRVLIYGQIPTANQAAAGKVLGQVDFNTDAITPNTSVLTSFVSNFGSTDTIPQPSGLAFDGTNLYVSDPSDYRVMQFSPADIPVTGKQVLNNGSELLKQEGLIVLAGKAVANDTVSVVVQGTTYTYTVQSSDTLDSIETGIISKINSGSGDPNVLAASGASADTVLLLSKNPNADLNSIAYSASTSNTTDLTATAAGSYLAGGFSGTLAPGTVFEIDNPNVDGNGNVLAGYELADFTATANTTQTLPTVMNGPSGTTSSVQVYVDGFPVPILKVSPAQIVAQIPYTFEDSSTHAVDRVSLSVYVRTIHKNGQILTTNAAPAAFTDANPGLFASPSTTEPRPALNAMHQPGNPSSTISLAGTITTGDTIAISVAGTSYSYTVTANDSLNSVAANLAQQINAAGNSNVTAAAGAAGTVTVTARLAGSAGTGIAVTATVTAPTGKTAGETVSVSNATTCCSTSGTGAVTVYNPVQANEVITLLATGLGNVQDSSGNIIATTAGVPYAGTQPNSVSNLVNVTVDGTAGTVLDAGLPNGSEGVYAVKVQMPASLPSSGVISVYIAQNAFISNTVTLPAGAAAGHTLVLYVDSPTQGQSVTPGTFTASGWAVDSNGTVTSIAASLDGTPLSAATRVSRPDVCAAYPNAQDCKAGNPVGWSFTLNTSQLSQTNHVLTFSASSSEGDSQVSSVTFSVPGVMNLAIEAPQAGATVAGSLRVFGWATSKTASIPANSVTVRVDGGAPIATASFSRPDVCAAFPSTFDCSLGNNNVGYSTTIDTTQLASGTHTLLVQATDTNGVHRSGSQSFTINNGNNGAILWADLPNTAGETLSGNVSLMGWAGSPSAIITQVAVSIDGSPMGIASFLPRPDVCGSYPTFAGCPSGASIGWMLPLDTTTLANGAHTLQVVAYAGGTTQTLTRPFNVSNYAGLSPIHTFIDTPQAGEAVSGSITPAGWAVSDEAAITSVKVSIDGVAVPSSYGTSRPDVCAVFTGRAGCPNVGWASSPVDTTQFADGQHVLTFSATSANGQTYTISNNFTVANATNGVVMYIDTNLNTPLTGLTQISGWAGVPGAQITSVTLSVDGKPVQKTTETLPRPDVCASYATLGGCPNGSLGWSFSFDPTQYPPGAHSISVSVTDGTVTGAMSANITIASPSTPLLAMYVDNPSPSTTFVGTVNVSGWATDSSGNLGSVSLAVDGTPLTLPITYHPRGDVCASLHYAGACANAGWSALLDSTMLTDGAHTLSVTATSGGQSRTISQGFTVANWTNVSPTQIFIDNPAPGASPLAGQTVLAGWAYSRLGPITAVTITIDDTIVAQPAVYGIARTDVCSSANSQFNCPDVGWNYTLDTTLLADGVHTLQVTAQIPQGGLVPLQRNTISTTFSVSNYTE